MCVLCVPGVCVCGLQLSVVWLAPSPDLVRGNAGNQITDII